MSAQTFYRSPILHYGGKVIAFSGTFDRQATTGSLDTSHTGGSTVEKVGSTYEITPVGVGDIVDFHFTCFDGASASFTIEGNVISLTAAGTSGSIGYFGVAQQRAAK